MPWRNGGVIGQRNLPSSNSASGVWQLSEAESARRQDSWPFPSISSPTEVAGLVLWLDGSDRLSFFSSAVGGSVLSESGGIFARWEDRSGGGRHFTQADSFYRPSWAPNQKNGQGAANFNEKYVTSTFSYTVGSIFIVWRHPTLIGQSQPAVIGSRTTSSSKTANSTLNYCLTLPNANNVAVDPSTAGAYRLNGVTPGGAFNTFSSGVPVRTAPDRWQYTSVVFSLPVAGSKAFTLGADSFGAASARSLRDGVVGEVIAYSGALTLGQVVGVEGYLIRKWGLA